MKANYHSHTWRCNHAVGDEEAYVKNAVERGLSTFGFSDHTPYLFPGTYYSSFRMKMDQLEDYVSTVLNLRQKYCDTISLPLGLEAEYYPRFFNDLLTRLQDYPIDYLILGQHYTNSEVDGVYSGRVTTDPQDLKDYCTGVADAIQTGLFSYIAHPDLINFVGSKSLYKDWMRTICKEAISCRIPLELNFLGLCEGRNYPNHDFLEIAAEEGCRMVFGIDAHRPEAVSDTKTEERAITLISEYGLSLLPDVPLLSIR